MTELVTKDSLKALLEDPDKDFVEVVIGRALWALFQRQTSQEQCATETSEDNGVGFTGYHAKSGSISAMYWKKHGHLGRCTCKANWRTGHKKVDDSESWRRENWTKPMKNGYPKLCMYAKQLNEIANERANETPDEKMMREQREIENAKLAASRKF